MSEALRALSATTPHVWPRLARWLVDHGHTVDPEAVPRQFSGGPANLDYLIPVDGAPLVLRRRPVGPVAEGRTTRRANGAS